MGPVNGLIISKNTIDLGPSQHTGPDGYIAKAGVMVTSQKCPFHPSGDPLEDDDGYGAQNILVEKNKIRGTTRGSIGVRDWARWAAEDQPRTAFTNIRLVKNHHQLLDEIVVTYYFGDTTHDCYLRIKPPKQGVLLWDFGTNNDIDIPGNPNPGTIPPHAQGGQPGQKSSQARHKLDEILRQNKP
jgi:hypothetical protein